MATVTFAAYFDESYSERVMAIGGDLSPEAQWVRFEAEWREFLARFEITNPFHMTDFMAGEKRFAGWPEAKRTQCIDWFTGIIARRAQFRVAVGMDRMAFDELMPQSEIGHFGFCIMEWMHEAERFMDRHGIAGPISYVFESGSGFGAQIFDSLAWIKRRPKLRARYRLSAFTFSDKKCVLPLQASDVLVWEARRHFIKMLSSPSPPKEESLRLLASRGVHKALWHGRAELERWKRDLDAFMADCPEEDIR